MNWSNIKLILNREIRDQLRDRRTLFVVLVLPLLLYPLLGMSFLQVSQFMQQQPSHVLVVGAPKLAGLPPLFEAQHFASRLTDAGEGNLLEVTFAEQLPEMEHQTPEQVRAEALRLVEEGTYDAALIFPPDFAGRLETFRRAISDRGQRLRDSSARRPAPEDQIPLAVPSPEPVRSPLRDRSLIADGRLGRVMRTWTDEIGRSNLESAGLPVDAAKPFTLSPVDVSVEPGQFGRAGWSKIFPVLLLIWALTGAFYPAVDLCAGEKERGTLETLLCSPAERCEIVVGKLLTIMLFSVATALLNVVSMAVTGLLVFSHLANFGSPPLLPILWFPLALIPVAALFSALCLALAAFARSSKEGQYYLMPLLLVTTPLIVLPMGPGVELTLGNSLIPVTGMVLLLREILQGNTAAALAYVAPVMIVTLGCCLVAIRWAVDQFNSESVLFRESERFGLGLWLRHLLHDRQPTPTAAGAVFCGIVILMVRFFMGLAVPSQPDLRGMAVSILVTQLAVVLTPALLMTVMLTKSPVQTLQLRRPPWLGVPAAAALAIAIQPAAKALSSAVVQLYPISDAIKEAMRPLEALIREAPWPYLLAFMALAPAICEELAFRGFILSGFHNSGRKWQAVFYSALFFGLTHAILQQSIMTFAVGLVLGLIAYQTGSVLPGMIFHLIHNGINVLGSRAVPELLDRLPWLEAVVSREGGDFTYTWQALVASILASVLLLAWFNRVRPATS